MKRNKVYFSHFLCVASSGWWLSGWLKPGNWDILSMFITGHSTSPSTGSSVPNVSVGMRREPVSCSRLFRFDRYGAFKKLHLESPFQKCALWLTCSVNGPRFYCAPTLPECRKLRCVSAQLPNTTSHVFYKEMRRSRNLCQSLNTRTASETMERRWHSKHVQVCRDYKCDFFMALWILYG